MLAKFFVTLFAYFPGKDDEENKGYADSQEVYLLSTPILNICFQAKKS